uniref:F-box domain-containing protein n=1 Tax=Fusarium oxysporum (strain Fo5176) TaxID=660025 RepID=A0A0D2YCI6_FUSOF
MSHVLYFGLPQVFHLVEACNKGAKGSSTASRQANYGGSNQANTGLTVKDLGTLRLITKGSDEPEPEPGDFGEATLKTTPNIRRLRKGVRNKDEDPFPAIAGNNFQKTKWYFFILPPELNFIIATFPEPKELATLLRTSKQIYPIIDNLLYYRDAKSDSPDALLWVVKKGRLNTARKAIIAHKWQCTSRDIESECTIQSTLDRFLCLASSEVMVSEPAFGLVAMVLTVPTCELLCAGEGACSA